MKTSSTHTLTGHNSQKQGTSAPHNATNLLMTSFDQHGRISISTDMKPMGFPSFTSILHQRTSSSVSSQSNPYFKSSMANSQTNAFGEMLVSPTGSVMGDTTVMLSREDAFVNISPILTSAITSSNA